MIELSSFILFQEIHVLNFDVLVSFIFHCFELFGYFDNISGNDCVT